MFVSRPVPSLFEDSTDIAAGLLDWVDTDSIRREKQAILGWFTLALIINQQEDTRH